MRTSAKARRLATPEGLINPVTTFTLKPGGAPGVATHLLPKLSSPTGGL